MNLINRILNRGNSLCVLTGCIALAAISILTATGIATRIFDKPLQGTYELTGFLCACAAGCGLELARRRKDNITVDILFEKFHGKVKTVLLVLNDILCMLIFGVTGYFILRYGITLAQTGELTETLRIPFHPFVFCLCFGCLFVALCYAVEVIKALRGKEEKTHES